MMARIPTRVRGSLTALLALLALPAPVLAQHEEPPPPAAYALENVTVVHSDGRREAGVTIVVRGGLIEAMGPGVSIPADARVLEGDSLRVYPGMVDAFGSAEMEIPEADRANVLAWDPPRDAQGFTPHRRVADHLTGTGADGRGHRGAGVIAAGIHPEGGMAPGQTAAVLFRKTTATSRDLVARPSVGLAFTFQGSRSGYPSSLFGVMALFRQMFEDAGRHALLLSEYAASPMGLAMPLWDPDFDALNRATGGELPVFFQADDDEEIRRVLALADEIGFRPVIVGGEEAWEVADVLAARSIPVLVSVAFPDPVEWAPPEPGEKIPGEEGTDAPTRPQLVSPEIAGEAPPQFDEQVLEPAAAREKERLENAYANPHRLLEAGVAVALTSGGGAGDLREGVVKAMEYGLSEVEALAAVTATPASILGIPSVVVMGQGMAANFIVTDGPLFADETGIRYTFVEGKMEEVREPGTEGGI